MRAGLNGVIRPGVAGLCVGLGRVAAAVWVRPEGAPLAVHLGWAAGVAAPPGCSGGPAAGVDGLLVAGDSGCEVGCFGEEVPGRVPGRSGLVDVRAC